MILSILAAITSLAQPAILALASDSLAATPGEREIERQISNTLVMALSLSGDIKPAALPTTWQPTNIVWIAPDAGTTNQPPYAGISIGTPAHPLQGRLDELVSSQPSYSEIHLTAPNKTKGFAWRRGDMFIRDHVRIIGDNPRAAIVRDTNFSSGWSCTVLASQPFVEFVNLTIDADGRPGIDCAHGLVFVGQHQSASNCHAVHWCGSMSNQWEAYGIYGGAIDSGISNAIVNCQATDPRGDYTDGITASGDYALIMSNYSNVGPNGMLCYGDCGSTHGRFLNNVAAGGEYGFYADTGNMADAIFNGNTFTNTRCAFCMVKRYDCTDGLTFINNYFQGRDASISIWCPVVGGYSARGITGLVGDNTLVGQIGIGASWETNQAGTTK